MSFACKQRKRLIAEFPSTIQTPLSKSILNMCIILHGLNIYANVFYRKALSTFLVIKLAWQSVINFKVFRTFAYMSYLVSYPRNLCSGLRL